MRGLTTTVKPLPVPTEMHKLLARNATDEQLRASQSKIGEVFEAKGLRYRIVEVYRDDLKRLLAVGKLEEI